MYTQNYQVIWLQRAQYGDLTSSFFSGGIIIPAEPEHQANMIQIHVVN
jgi:hypothetical protein